MTDISRCKRKSPADGCAGSVDPDRTDQPAPGGTRQVDAYEHYLKGRSLYNLAKDEESDRQALAHSTWPSKPIPILPWRMPRDHGCWHRLLPAMPTRVRAQPLYNDAITEARRAVELARQCRKAQLALGYACLPEGSTSKARVPFMTRPTIGRAMPTSSSFMHYIR